MSQPQDPETRAMAERADDVDLQPGINADAYEDIETHLDPRILELYDVYSYRHAAAILATSFPEQLRELQEALLNFSITRRDIGMPGGNESGIPKLISRRLRPTGWNEARIQGDLVVRMQEHSEDFLDDGSVRKHKHPEKEAIKLESFIDGHKIDYVKGKVAFDLEWNSKDQTFDRDLYAMRMFHECGLISVGVMLTRSEKLNPLFSRIPRLKKDGSVEYDKDGNPVPVKDKYGASTTWMGKLLYRLNAGRHGGCPVLAFGITPRLITDWESE
ncbi:BglII/BstYI family type II restriction endonuclease [Salinicola peritrichatus]|uniref:BglII/BstYI family type II restriction endonuclease n=1 Tax=Salinicola peritrichatus TaxID=1267424 RepID=UPI000DA1C029|nr:BglII/BstYI family type II restriction endonuclease [Salinicola peritrichatus]